VVEKSDNAFRTISEAADDVGVPAHVLRFWESRFSQLQPMKRAGGRRYYRPADMILLRQIKALLHDQGLTIRGAVLALDAKANAAPPVAQILPATALPARSQPETAFGADRQALQAIRDRLAAALAA
jgi:DNA-binding transcriptional MerR regulator